MKALCLVVTVSGLLFAVPAWSGCEEPVIPEIPNPDLAGEAEMLRAQRAVQRYLSLQEDYLHCVRYDIRRHNRAVERMHEVANDYNSTARRYKARMEARNMITELALVADPRFSD